MKKKKIEPQEEHEKEVQETTDMLTGEDVMEVTAYMANAPDCCSAEEKAENAMSMLGASVVDTDIFPTEEEHETVQEETEIDYKQEVKASVDAEYDEFKESLCEKGAEEVFNHAFEVNAKTEFMLSITEDAEYEPWVYKGLYQEGGKVLANLYDEYISNPKSSINTRADTKEFIEGYCYSYYSDLCEEAETEELNQEVVMGGM